MRILRPVLKPPISQISCPDLSSIADPWTNISGILVVPSCHLVEPFGSYSKVELLTPPNINVPLYVDTADANSRLQLRVLCSSQVPWSN